MTKSDILTSTALSIATMAAALGLALALLGCVTPLPVIDSNYVLTNDLPRADGSAWPVPSHTNTPRSYP